MGAALAMNASLQELEFVARRFPERTAFVDLLLHGIQTHQKLSSVVSRDCLLSDDQVCDITNAIRQSPTI